MKHLLLALVLIIPQLAFADRCPDLSGRWSFQGRQGRVSMKIDQDECLQITIERSINNGGKTTKEKPRTLPLDGVFHQGVWNGIAENGKSSAQFVMGKLELAVQSPSGDVIAKETWRLMPDKTIEIKDMDGGTTIAKKGR